MIRRLALAALLVSPACSAQPQAQSQPANGDAAATGQAFVPPQPASASQPVPKNAPQDARSEEHTSELQSLMRISYAVFCLKKKKEQHIRLIHIPTRIDSTIHIIYIHYRQTQYTYI